MRDAIDVWMREIDDDLGLDNFEGTKERLYALGDSGHLQFFCINFTGIFAYTVGHEVTGEKTLYELIFYIKPCFRGDLRLVRRYLRKAEKLARELSCDNIRIGASIGYKDQKYLKVLNRFGYDYSAMIKRV